jgi:hypothetical protein
VCKITSWLPLEYRAGERQRKTTFNFLLWKLHPSTHSNGKSNMHTASPSNLFLILETIGESAGSTTASPVASPTAATISASSRSGKKKRQKGFQRSIGMCAHSPKFLLWLKHGEA